MAAASSALILAPHQDRGPRRGRLLAAALAVLSLLAPLAVVPAGSALAARHVVVAPTGLFHLLEVSHDGHLLLGYPDGPGYGTPVLLDRTTGVTTPAPEGEAARITGFVRDNPNLRLEIDAVNPYVFTALWLRNLATGTRMRVDTDSAGAPLFAQWNGPGGTYLPRIAASPTSVSRDGKYVALCVDDMHGVPYLHVKNLVTGELKFGGAACGVRNGYGVLLPELSYNGRVAHVNGSTDDPAEHEGSTVPDFFLADRLVFPLGATVKVRTVKGWGSMTRDGGTLFLVRATRADGAAKPKGHVGAYNITTKKTKKLSGRYAIYGNQVFTNFAAFDKASFRGRYVVRGDRVAVVDRKKGRTTNIAKLMTAAGYPPTAYVQSRISGDGKVVLALTPTGTSPMTMRAYVAVTGW